MSKKKRKLRLKYKNIFLFFLVIFLFVYASYYILKIYHKNKNIIDAIPIVNKQQDEEVKKQQKSDYETCLNKPVLEEETLALKNQMDEIDSLIQTNKYQVSVYYEDIKTGFNYQYKADTIYYGCSLIKLVDALYLINKAIDGEIDLDQEYVTYSAKYKMGYSTYMSKHSFGDKVSLRDLITYAISVSDNSAHLMLIDYIGFNNLKAYGQSLGGKVILTGGDNFGNQTAEDTNIYLKEAYRIIDKNEEYGTFLKSIMDNDERNDFNTESIRIYHKYGSNDNNYHDIGLSLEENPYAISIFTLHEYTNHKEVVQNIHSKIRELHSQFHTLREKNCHLQVYGS